MRDTCHRQQKGGTVTTATTFIAAPWDDAIHLVTRDDWWSSRDSDRYNAIWIIEPHSAPKKLIPRDGYPDMGSRFQSDLWLEEWTVDVGMMPARTIAAE